MGAGKTTEAEWMATQHQALLLSEDEWLSLLYPGKISTFDDYLEYSKRLKPLVKQHVQQALKNGIDVVMDFPANTLSQRQWFKVLYQEIAAPHKLVYLNVSDEVCLKQIKQRSKQQPHRAAFDHEAMFYQVSSYFQPPEEAEGYNLILKCDS